MQQRPLITLFLRRRKQQLLLLNNSTISRHNHTKTLAELSKAKLSTLVVATTSSGFLAAGGPISWATFAAASFGTALCASSASTFNQVFEVERDRQMKRTRNRPLPMNAVTSAQAVGLGVTTGMAGTGLLIYGTDLTTAMFGLGNIALYAGLYTYLKPRHEINTWVGAVVGAIPPVMGWTAAGGSPFDIEALLLGGTLFLWQFPHFFALSWMHRADYARGGFQMVPCNDPTGDRTARLITRYTWYLSSIPLLSTLCDVTNSMFLVEGVALNAYALYVARNFHQDRTNANARKVFLTSLWYLPSFMTLFILHSKTWNEDNEEVQDGELRSYLKSYIQFVKSKGKEVCLHETHVMKNEVMEKSCPVTVAEKTVAAATSNNGTSINKQEE